MDESDDEEQTTERGARLARQALQLPHQRSAEPVKVPTMPAHPEVEEPYDALVEEGLAIGRAFAGRRSLPDRLRTLSSTHELRDRKSTRLNSSHSQQSRMPSSA